MGKRYKTIAYRVLSNLKVIFFQVRIGSRGLRKSWAGYKKMGTMIEDWIKDINHYSLKPCLFVDESLPKLGSIDDFTDVVKGAVVYDVVINVIHGVSSRNNFQGFCFFGNNGVGNFWTSFSQIFNFYNCFFVCFGDKFQRLRWRYDLTGFDGTGETHWIDFWSLVKMRGWLGPFCELTMNCGHEAGPSLAWPTAFFEG